MRNLVTSLLRHERIKTTLPKAKELRRWTDRMIGLGKEGSLHARRQALAIIQDKAVVRKVFESLAARFKDRPGGYSRIVKLGWRHGDRAPMSLVELLPVDSAGKAESARRSRRRSAERQTGAAGRKQPASRQPAAKSSA